MRKILCAPNDDGKSSGPIGTPLVERQAKKLEGMRILVLFNNTRGLGISLSCASTASLVKQSLKAKDENFESKPFENLRDILKTDRYQEYEIVIIIANSGKVEDFAEAMEHIKKQNSQVYVVFVSTVEYVEMAGPDLLVRSNELNGIKARVEEMLKQDPIPPFPSQP